VSTDKSPAIWFGVRTYRRVAAAAPTQQKCGLLRMQLNKIASLGLELRSFVDPLRVQHTTKMDSMAMASLWCVCTMAMAMLHIFGINVC
jgi:hypothetical protein